jgi:hypothetical protein
MALIIYLGGMILCISACTMPGDRIWEAHVDRGSFDAVRDLVVAEGRVFAVGPTNAVGNSDMGIRAWATDGQPLWEDDFDRAGGEDEAYAVAVSEEWVFVVGFTENVAGDQDFSILAYRADGDGTPQWENHYDGDGGADVAYAVAATENKVFIVGITTRDRDRPADTDWRIEAYQVDGTPLWQRDYDRDRSADTAQGVATDGQSVFVGGRTARRIEEGVFFDFSVRAYRVDDPEDVWEHHLHRDASGGEVGAVVAEGEMLFVGGDTFAPEGDGEFSIYAFHTANEDILWEDHFDRAGGRDFVTSIAVHEGRVFAVGMTCQTDSCENRPLNFDFSVRAYDAIDGPPRIWEEHIDLDEGNDHAYDVAAAGEQVFVVGRLEDAAGNFDWFLKTYSADGESLWEHQFDRAEGADEAMAVAVSGNAIFVGGRTDSPLGTTDFSVMAYRR